MRSILFSVLVALSTLGIAYSLPGNQARSLGARASHTLEARAPAPSVVKRSTPAKRKQTPLTPAQEISRHLCPFGMSVCPITSSPPSSTPTSLAGWVEEGFECAEFDSDLTSCGGCGTVDSSYDCTAIPGALGVSCIVGSCRVDSCVPGYTLTTDGKICVRSH